MFSLASEVLSKIASPAFKMAYERGRAIWEAKDELKKLKETIETIQAVLIDVEKKQESSVAIKNWIARVRDVLYDADDLFDEVAADDMLNQQIIKEDNPLEKVRAYCSKLNPVVSKNSIAKKVKAIRKRLLAISADMAQFNFVVRQHEELIHDIKQGQDLGSFVDSREVFGRDKDKKVILEMLLNHQSPSRDDFSVIAIVGIGGMGKTTLAQLVYNDKKVEDHFEKRWFTCIYDIPNEKIIGKIFQSICELGQNYEDFALGHLQDKIRESVRGKKFLLVLDDVWDNDHGRWIDRMGLLSGCAKGSKIIVTTRSLEVASAVGAVRSTHTLYGLSEDESWALFKRVASTDHEWEKDSRWIDLGKGIVKKCANVPLAIKSIGSLLHAKATIQEWEFIMKEQLVKVEESGQVSVISVLKLSYDHLHSNLKRCFAYCSLFPKDYVFDVHDLIYLWIAQGYIKPDTKEQTLEEVGHSYFMDLFRMSFFQEAKFAKFGVIEECKMHDLIHDLARKVAAEESIKGTPRHVTSNSLANGAPLLNGNRLRSLLFINRVLTRGLVLDQAVPKLKLLRTLKLSPGLEIENVPSSIGELKLLRYLDISGNKFKSLPDSVTKLLNLRTLKLRRCVDLEVLPNDMRKLVNLRHLITSGCDQLKHMPPGFGELSSLQHLDQFKVGREMSNGQCSKLCELFGLKLSGLLQIDFEVEHDSYDDSDFDGVEHDSDFDGVECWQPLVNNLQGLSIYGYKGLRIPSWANGRLVSNLTTLRVGCCPRVKCLPSLRHLSNLKSLTIHRMRKLEYIESEEEEEEGKQNALLLPYLEVLELRKLPKLKGWSRRVEAETMRKDNVAANGEEHSSCTSAIDASAAPPQLLSFPSLSKLLLIKCQELKYMPLCPSIRSLSLKLVDAELLLPQLLSIRDSSSPSTTTTTTTTTSSSSLGHVFLLRCYGPTIFPGQSLTSLRQLYIDSSYGLKRVELPPLHLNMLERLTITSSCREFDIMWEDDNKVVDWDSLPNLRHLTLDRIPSKRGLPNWLRNLQSLGTIEIRSGGRLLDGGYVSRV